MDVRTESNRGAGACRCLTTPINDTFSRCLSDRARCRCDYAFLFGDDYLCIHPRHKEFD